MGFFDNNNEIRLSNDHGTTKSKKPKQSLGAPEDWTPTKSVGTFFQVDEEYKFILIPEAGLFGPKGYNLYSYNDILEVELIEDNHTITKGGLVTAAAGGLAFGGFGAVAGSVIGKKTSKKVVNSLSIKITTKSISNPICYIKIITTPTKTSSFFYKTYAKNAQEILSIFSIILNEVAQDSKAEAEVATPISASDEIRKFKALLDDGIITSEEFESKKRQLLGL